MVSLTAGTRTLVGGRRGLEFAGCTGLTEWAAKVY